MDKVIELDRKYKELLAKSDTLVGKCKVYKDFFDELIGRGTSQKIFGEKNNIFKITDAYQDLIEEAEKVNNKMKEKTNKMNKKYERYK